MKLITSVLCMSAVIFFAFTANGYGQDDEAFVKKFTHYKVKLDAQWKSNSLEVHKEGKCKKNNHYGCLLFEENHEGSITFYLNSSTNLKTCSNAKEVITRIEVATESENQELIKGDFSKKPEEEGQEDQA